MAGRLRRPPLAPASQPLPQPCAPARCGSRLFPCFGGRQPLQGFRGCGRSRLPPLACGSVSRRHHPLPLWSFSGAVRLRAVGACFHSPQRSGLQSLRPRLFRPAAAAAWNPKAGGGSLARLRSGLRFGAGWLPFGAGFAAGRFSIVFNNSIIKGNNSIVKIASFGLFILKKNPPFRRRPLGKYPRKVLRGSSPLVPVLLGLRETQLALVFPEVVHSQKRNIVLPPPQPYFRRSFQPCAQGACSHSLAARSAVTVIPCRWGLFAWRGGFGLSASASSRRCARVTVVLCSGWHSPPSSLRTRPRCSLHLQRRWLQLRPFPPSPLPPRGRGRLRRYKIHESLLVGGGAPSLLAFHCHSPRLFVFSWRFTVIPRGGAV